MPVLTTEEYDAVLTILKEVKGEKESHHLGKPFLTTYQIAIVLKKDNHKIFDNIVEKIAKKKDKSGVGGKGHNCYQSPAQYLGKALSTYIKKYKGAEKIKIEGGFFSGQNACKLSFKDKTTAIKASLNSSQPISVYRFVGTD